MIRIYNISEISEKEILSRETDMPDVSAAVSAIISDVRENGDEALKKYSARFDGAELKTLELSEEERREALKLVDTEFMKILREAAENILEYHSCQRQNGYMLSREGGVVLGQRVLPLERVGLYVPGGTASYPSTVLMNCIPAKIAGVSEIIMTTPPDKNGGVSPNIIAAAEVAGVDRIIKCGGAQAVAALAFGTQSVPRVDKIVGPGNVFVSEAKRQVYGDVDIDMIAGPSEILVVSDEKSEPLKLAADMLSQAEHDKLATAVLVTTSEKLAWAVAGEIEKQLEQLPRAEIARTSIDNNGKIIVVKSIEQAIEISNAIAPEHLELCIDEPFEYLNTVKNAGSVFLGRNCPEALGDYFAGTNHTLPTGGRARFSSPLSVDDFVKKMSYMYYSRSALNAVADRIAFFAEAEGLSGHAKSARSRSNSEGPVTKMSKFMSERFSKLIAYVPGEQPRDFSYIKLNTNESPYPPAPAVFEALNAGEIANLRLYSDPECGELKRTLADYLGVGSENTFVGNGSDEILSFAFMAFCDKNIPVSYPDISYGFYSVYADLYGIEKNEIPLREDFSIAPEDYFDLGTTIFIANPNAPTGLCLSAGEIEDIVKANPDNVVVIDEAYVDFGGESCVQLTKKYDNLLVIQTYSKSRSFAGGRLGFAVGCKPLIGDLEKLRYSTNPFNVDRLALAAGVAAINNQSYYDNNIFKIIQNREYTTSELRELGFEVLDSKANFLFASTAKLSGAELYAGLRERGILVRYFNRPRIDRFVRITIGTREQMDALISAVKEMLNNA